MQIDQSSILALVGRNGAGKSTVLKAWMGQLPLRSGQRRLDGRDITGLALDACSRMGIALVPENRLIFAGLSCEENLTLASLNHPPGQWTLNAVYHLFPRLKERSRAQGTSLSGGEQQMLSIGRALMTNPRYLLLDEPTEGLAPMMVEQIVGAIATISQQGMAVILVEQNFHIPERLADRFALIDSGRITWTGQKEDITESLKALLAGIKVSP